MRDIKKLRGPDFKLLTPLLPHQPFYFNKDLRLGSWSFQEPHLPIWSMLFLNVPKMILGATLFEQWGT